MTWLKGVALLALVTAIGLSGGAIAHARADVHGAAQRAPRLYAVGHSWVVGTSSGQQIGYVDRLARDARATRIDADHVGYTAPQVRRLLRVAPRCTSRDLAVVQVGLNDVRRYGDAGLPRFRRSLRAILTRLDGCPVILVQEPGALSYAVRGQPLLGNNGVVRDYRAITATVVREHDNVTLVRPRLLTSDYLPDGLHPDRSGNRVIYRAIKHTPTWKRFLNNR